MPQLNKTKIQEVKLPSSTDDDPAIVSIDCNINAGQTLDLYDSDNKSEATLNLIASAIQSWNFTDEDNKAVPISPENVRRMSIGDFDKLSALIMGQLNITVSAQAVSTSEKKPS